MRKLLFTVLSVMPLFAVGQNYEGLWQRYDSLVKDGLPSSAVEVLGEIYETSLERKDFGQMLKSYIYMNRKKSEIDGKSYSADRIMQFEKWFDGLSDSREKAVLSAIIAKSYSEYYISNSDRIKSLTPVEADGTQTDLQYFSGEQLLDKVLSYTRYFMENMDTLVSSEIGDSSLLYDEGELGELTRHNEAAVSVELLKDALYELSFNLRNMYVQTYLGEEYIDSSGFESDDFAMRSEYDFIAVIARMYRGLEQEYRKKGMDDALLVTEIDRIDFVRRVMVSRGPLKGLTGVDSLILRSYDRLQDRYHEQTALVPYISYCKVQVMRNDDDRKKDALELIRQTNSEYPGNKWQDAMKNIYAEISCPFFSARIDKCYPDDEISMFLSSRNLKSVQLKIFRAKKGMEYVRRDYSEGYDKFLRKYAVLYSTTDIGLSSSGKYAVKCDTVQVKGLPEGKWYMYFTAKGSNGQPSMIDMEISRYSVISTVVDGKKNVVVLDKKSGIPMSGVSVEAYADNSYTKDTGRYVTDEKGTVVVGDETECVQVYAGDGYKSRFYVNFHEYISRDNRYEYKLYTDRAVYRPGQKMHVSGFVASKSEDGSYHPVDKLAVDVTIQGRGQAGVKMSSEVLTDEYGTFVADFSLPEHCANGDYTVSAGDNRISVHIEEYKRPSFEVELYNPKDAFTLNDSIHVYGKASMLNGTALQGGKVAYKVERAMSSWMRWWFNDYALIGSGVTETDGAGGFDVPLQLVPVEGYDEGFYSYRITASVTSVSGETQEQELVIYAGDKSYIVSCYSDETICKEDGLKIVPQVTNLSNEPVAVKGIFSLIPEGSDVPALEGEFVSNEEKIIDVARMESGRYKLLVTISENGQYQKYDKEIVLFSESDTVTPVDGHLWTYQLSRNVAPDRPAELMIGTRSAKAYVVMFLTNGEKTVERRDCVLENELKKISVPMFDSGDKGIGITVLSYCDGELYRYDFTYAKVKPDNKLRYKWNVFRDRLRPGQNEEWSLQLYNPDGSPAKANVMSFMYDSALDMIYRNRIDFMLNHSEIISLSSVNSSYNGWHYGDIYFVPGYVNCTVPEKDRFKSFITDRDYWGAYRRPVLKLESARSLSLKSVADSNTGLEENSVNGCFACVEEVATAEESVQLRSNFAETAFFYPRLRTDDNGEVALSFVVPESLTKWHFYTLAHNMNMYQVQIDTTVVVNKDLMIMPDVPRYVRVGDDVSVSAALVNRTSKGLDGQAILELFDPDNGKVIYRQAEKFLVDSNSTGSVSFRFKVGDEYTLLGIRMKAESPSFSDGEQRLLPVLSDKVHIVESEPFFVKGDETKRYGLNHLFNNNDRMATNKVLTVDITAKPVWAAIKALPSLNSTVYDNAISDITALYANMMARHVVTSEPEIERVINRFTASCVQSDAKPDDDMIDIMLEEAPWNMESDSECLKRLVDLFDTNNANYQEQKYIDRIARLQCPDGSISWFEGGRGNYYMTRFVAEKLLMLKSHDMALSSKAEDVLNKAVGYINDKVATDYQKRVMNGILDLQPSDLDFAYMHAMYGMSLTGNSKYAYDGFVSILHDNINSLSLVYKAKAVVILAHEGNMAEAQRFFNSLKEYSASDEELGLYFLSNVSSSVRNNNPVSSHVVIMQAYKAMGADDLQMDSLRLWLLQQKRTQDWGNVISTVDAVDELINSGTSWIDDNGTVEVKLGRKRFSIDSSEGNPLSDRKIVFSGDDIPNRLTDVQLQKNGTSPSWGAVYAQYDIPYSRLVENGSGMKITKQTFVRKVVDGKEVLQTLDKAEIKVGDEYVSQIRFSVDRDYDFVHICDKRASCAEPGIVLSGYKDFNGLTAYVRYGDSATDYFFDTLKKGEYVIQATYRIDRKGRYTIGNATIQSMYAPEFNAHSESGFIEVR